METIVREGTPKTPYVRLDGEKGIIEIKGRSIPENSIEFYKPLIDWLEEYSSDVNNDTAVNVQLEYFNTSSSKCILDIFKKLESIFKKGQKVEVNWYYEEDDEDMFEAGEDYQSIINIPFKMIEMEE
ncbi:DUF1987 domain-containing protein [Plebeiibacterium sediminum]|uniref:DUF1987 domain-containing protein n=1 Tax=Plebeiibacterium sediminum TaxID=2992112 RepID=A0AAE3M3C8_9BACT|nr:DUF1987 domain-containing protein [Plebeiobacterium sediminum]MCW3786476.1 DUF1987 domain-containing protein [Plebeiobacterium sediminum]